MQKVVDWFWKANWWCGVWPRQPTLDDSGRYLAQQNPHARDAHTHFEEIPHKNTIQGVEGITPETDFTSVTTWVHQHFEHFDAKKIFAEMMRNHKKWNDPVANAKYYGKTAETIEQMWAIAGRDAAAAGTAMHYKIERFFNTSPEHQQRSANRIQILSQLPERVRQLTLPLPDRMDSIP